ncbi:MAG: hypothetical protein Q7J54_00180 [Candidatus Woesearchaeota archaeon]|nr:hypothetical protein [Candidatus Woesearchaeota archaeon]
MRIEQHVIKSFDDFLQNEFDAALLHACIALDGTAQKYVKKVDAGREDYVKLIRDYYWIIEPMIGAGLNLEETKFRRLTIMKSNKPITDPDFADVVYNIFRCSHAHGKEIPAGYGFLPVEDGKSYWQFGDNIFYMPTRAIWALLAISIFAKTNKNIKTNTNHFLTWGSQTLGIGEYKFHLKDYWGEEDKIRNFFSKQNLIRVKLEFPKK